MRAGQNQRVGADRGKAGVSGKARRLLQDKTAEKGLGKFLFWIMGCSPGFSAWKICN